MQYESTIDFLRSHTIPEAAEHFEISMSGITYRQKVYWRVRDDPEAEKVYRVKRRAMMGQTSRRVGRARVADPIATHQSPPALVDHMRNNSSIAGVLDFGSMLRQGSSNSSESVLEAANKRLRDKIISMVSSGDIEAAAARARQSGLPDMISMVQAARSSSK
jgi:hypothetical protein